MTTTTQGSANDLATPHLRWWLMALGIVPFISTALLTGRLIWEQTVWTWERGPQMVGFSLAHGPYVVLLLAPFLLALWAVIALVLIIVNFFKKRSADRPTLITLGLAVLLLFVDTLPSGFWQRLFIREMASSPRSADLLIYDAYDKDFRTVKAMLAHGVPISATDHHEWRTVLHASAIAGDLRTLRFLVASGADVNSIDRSGDSPAELAASRGHQDCVAFLQEHGGKRIRGGQAQHQKALHDEVQDDIKEMEPSRP